MRKNHTRLPGTHNFWSTNEIAVCGRCGAEFQKTSHAQKYCGCKPTKLYITLEQSLIVARFRNLCRKYSINVYAAFEMATRCHGKNFYRLITPQLQGGIGPDKRRLWIMLLERFNDQLERGYYELKAPMKNLKTRQTTWTLEKRAEPLQKHCPMKLSHCAGAVLPGSCPRNWKECSFSQFQTEKEHDYCSDAQRG